MGPGNTSGAAHHVSEPACHLHARYQRCFGAAGLERPLAAQCVPSWGGGHAGPACASDDAKQHGLILAALHCHLDPFLGRQPPSHPSPQVHSSSSSGEARKSDSARSLQTPHPAAPTRYTTPPLGSDAFASLILALLPGGATFPGPLGFLGWQQLPSGDVCRHPAKRRFREAPGRGQGQKGTRKHGGPGASTGEYRGTGCSAGFSVCQDPRTSTVPSRTWHHL